MEIYLNNAIMHIVDNQKKNIIYSQNELDIDSDMVSEFLTKHIKKLNSSIAVKNATFLPDSPILNIFESFKNKEINFKELSKKMCQNLADIMIENKNIPSASIIFAQIDLGRYPHLAIIKLNHRDYYTHETTNEETRLIRSKKGLPFDSGKVEEAALIAYSPMIIKLIEKPYPLEKSLESENNSDEYFSSEFLKCEPELSKKTIVEIINNAISDIEEIHGFLQACKIKLGLIDESIENEGEIRLEQIGKYLEKEIQSEFLKYLKDYGLNEDVFLGDKFVSQKFGKHTIKSSNGTEIKIPVHIFDDENAIKFIQKENSIDIKGIKFV